MIAATYKHRLGITPVPPLDWLPSAKLELDRNWRVQVFGGEAIIRYKGCTGGLVFRARHIGGGTLQVVATSKGYMAGLLRTSGVTYVEKLREYMAQAVTFEVNIAAYNKGADASWDKWVCFKQQAHNYRKFISGCYQQLVSLDGEARSLAWQTQAVLADMAKTHKRVEQRGRILHTSQDA